MSDTEYRLEQGLQKESLETKHYDVVSTKWRKIVSGGVAVAINEFAEALKLDWYPRLSYEQIAGQHLLQAEIKHQILHDWSIQQSADGLGWHEKQIRRVWPSWVLRTYSERQTSVDEKDFQAWLNKTLHAADDFTKLSKLLSNPLPAEEQDPEPLGGHRETPSSPEELYRTALDGYAKIIEALTSYKNIPGPNVDIESEILNPSDKVRLKLIKGLNENDRAILIKVSSIVNQISGRFLRQARDIMREEKKVER